MNKVRKEKVGFSIKGQNLVGTLFVPQGVSFPAPGVVFYHGRVSNQKSYIPRAEVLAEQGIVCFTFDFRGRGESEGAFDKLTINDGLTDALAGFDFLSSQEVVNKDRIGICGASFGGYLAAIISSQRRVKSMVFRAPALYRDTWRDIPSPQVSRQELIKFLKSGRNEKNLAFQSIRKFKGSLLVIGSEKDETIPAEVVKAYYRNAISAKEKKIVFIKTATHKLTNEKWSQEFIKLMVDWFKKTLMATS